MHARASSQTFFWEQDEAVQALLHHTPCLQVCSVGVTSVVYDGTPWSGDRGPEQVSPVAFFVARAFPLPAAVPMCDMLEVYHVSTEWSGAEVR